MENENALARIQELEGEVQRLSGALKAAEGATSPSPLPEEAALAADGKAYRQYLKEEVKRLAGILKSEAEASLLLKALPHAPAEALKELLESYQRKVEEKFPPRPLAEMAAAEAAAAGRPAVEANGPARPVRFS